MQRLADALGLTVVTALLVLWAVSGAIIVVGLLVLLLAGATVLGVVLFAIGMIGSFAVTTAMLRARAEVPPRKNEG